MLRKSYFMLLSALGAILLSAVFVQAQIANITGRVEVEKEGGVKETVADALVEIYRTDINTGNKADRTDKDGNFRFVGLPPGATYLLTVSGEGLEPLIIRVKAGMESQVVTVRPGDGTRWTEEQVRSALTAAGGELTEEQKKQLAELEKRRAEIEARNKRIEASNALIERVLKEGSEAFNKKNYDLAIAKFQEGYEASEDFVGSAPVLLNNKGASLMLRAIDNYNASIKTTDGNERGSLRTQAREDFEEALASYSKSWSILKGAKQADVVDQNVFNKAKIDALTGGKKIIGYMLRTELIAATKGPDAKELSVGYIEMESDKAKKLEAQTNLGRFLLGVGDLDGSMTAYRKAVEMSPKDPDALAGLGLALYSASFEKEELKQESLNYMQLYLDVAPKDHSFRDSIQGAVDDLKAQKLKPQKVSLN